MTYAAYALRAWLIHACASGRAFWPQIVIQYATAVPVSSGAQRIGSMWETKVGGIFINYRSRDCIDVAKTLQIRLVEHFGEGQVFVACLSLEPGSDYRLSIE